MRLIADIKFEKSAYLNGQYMGGRMITVCIREDGLAVFHFFLLSLTCMKERP